MAELFPELEAERKEREKRKLMETLPRFSEPRNDSEELINLQWRYLALNDKGAWAALWARCLKVAGKLIRKEQKEKGFSLSEYDYEDKKMEAVEYVLRRYSRTYRDKSGSERRWFVSKSFISALYGGVRHALYYDAQKKKESGNENLRIDYVGDLFDVVQAKGEF